MNSNMYANYGMYGNYAMPSYQQGNYQQPVYQQPMYQQPMYQQQPQQVPQTKYLPLTFVNGVEGAKAFIVEPNKMIYLMDEENGVIYKKTADNVGKAILEPFAYKPIKIEDIGKAPQIDRAPTNTLSKDDLKPFVTINEFKAFERDIFNEIGKLSSLVEKTRGGAKNYEKRGNE